MEDSKTALKNSKILFVVFIIGIVVIKTIGWIGDFDYVWVTVWVLSWCCAYSMVIFWDFRQAHKRFWSVIEEMKMDDGWDEN